MARLSASKIDLARRCLWPFRPDAGPRNGSTFAASAGQDEHALIESTLLTGDTSPKSETHARWLEEWWPKHQHVEWHVEHPIALDPVTGETRQGPTSWDRRDYAWAPWRFMVGTPDAWGIEGGVLHDGVLRVVDWKTGNAAHIKDPSAAGQMLFLGLALELHLRGQGVRVRGVSLEYVLVNERRLWIESAIVSRAHLAAFRSELQALVEGADGNPQPVEGHWCRSHWCDYLGRCPVTRHALTHAAPPPEAPFKVALDAKEIESDEHAAWQYALIKAAGKRLEEATAAIKARAKSHPIPLGDGRFYGQVEKSRETIDIEAPGAVTLLEQMGMGAAVTIKRSSSKEAIERAAGPVAKEQGRTKKAQVGIALDALRQVGAVKTTSYTEIGEYEATKALEEA